MIERFTQNARNIIVLAQRESRALSHNYMGSETCMIDRRSCQLLEINRAAQSSSAARRSSSSPYPNM